MVAIVKDVQTNGKLPNSKVTKGKIAVKSDSDSDDDSDSSSSSEEEIKVDLKKAALAKQQKVSPASKPPVKVVKKEASESESDDDESEEEKPVKPIQKSIPKPPVKVVKKEDSESETESDDDESEEEKPVKTPVQKPIAVQKKTPIKPESEEEEDDEEEEEEKLVIHPKNGVNNRNNGFNKPCSNSKEDEIINTKLKEIATDVKSNEAAEKGDFKLFNLPQNLIEKLKAKKITYLYPIQIATLTHIRAGHDVIAQAS